MDFKDYLAEHGIDAEEEPVLFLRHAPGKKRFPESLREILFQALQGPTAVFDVYQQLQENNYVEKQMREAAYVAAFLGDAPGQARFVGLYRHRTEGDQPLTRGQIGSLSEIRDLAARGLPPIARDCLRFDLRPHEAFPHGGIRPVRIAWPEQDLVWHRWGHEADFEIIE